MYKGMEQKTRSDDRCNKESNGQRRRSAGSLSIIIATRLLTEFVRALNCIENTQHSVNNKMKFVKENRIHPIDRPGFVVISFLLLFNFNHLLGLYWILSRLFRSIAVFVHACVCVSSFYTLYNKERRTHLRINSTK